MIKFKVQSVRTLASPYKVGSDEEANMEVIYYLLVNMQDLPEKLPLDVNPREPKMTTNVAKRIKAAVRDAERDFYINNRGIVISAKSLKVDNVNSEVVLDLGDLENDEDRYLYGILDGGHTYTAILEERGKLGNAEKYVRVEVITNVQNISRLSDARNTSVQVSDIALFNLDHQFEGIQEAIANESYANDIAYKDNEDKPINVSEILRLIYAFDIDSYPDGANAPIHSYSGKAQVFKKFKNSYQSPLYVFLIKSIPLLVELYEKVYCEMGDKYVAYKERMGQKGKFGAVKGVDSTSDNMKSVFFGEEVRYNIPLGYIYPVFGAFRSLLKCENGEYSWSVNPIEMWNRVGIDIVQNVFESNNKNNPNMAGKDKTLWLGNYRIVDTEKFKLEADRLREELNRKG